MVRLGIPFLFTALLIAPAAYRLGPVQFQTARVFHYFLYFLIGVSLNLNGLSTGLLAHDGKLAKNWAGWLIAMLVGFLVGMAVVLLPALAGASANHFWLYASLLAFVVNCALRCFAFLALFT